MFMGLLLGVMSFAGAWPAEPQSSAVNLGRDLPTAFEPSGVAYRQGVDALWVVSDSGVLAQVDFSGCVRSLVSIPGDLEGVTWGADGDPTLYLGTENYPSIQGYVPARPIRTWNLPEMAFGDANTRLEALAFLPDGHCGILSYNNGQGSQYQSGGLFLAGHQGDGKIYVYDIDTSGSAVTFIGTFGPYEGRTDLSGLCFHIPSGTLYGIWDAYGVMGRFSDDLKTVVETWSFPVGSDNEEGIAIVGCGLSSSIVICEDDGGALHHVWLYREFLADSGGVPGECAWLHGDLNCDGIVSYADINPLVIALRGYDEYHAQYSGCYWYNADCNQDGYVSYADINPFVVLLSEAR
jgi:hypothetical protein